MSTQETDDGSSPSPTSSKTVSPGQIPSRPARNGIRKRVILGLMLGVILLGGISFGLHWWTVGRFIQSTDDAYVKADIVFLAPQVSGTITSIKVNDNAHVDKGDVLFTIDSSDYQAALQQAQANVQVVQASAQEVVDKIDLQTKTVAVARADLASAQASEKFANEEYERTAALHKRGNATLQRLQSAQTQLSAAKAATAKVRAVLARDQQQFNVLQTEQIRLQAQEMLAKASLQTAQLNLARTTVRAPVSGIVGNRQIEMGELVQPGVQAMSVVPDTVYAIANFKETQVRHMQNGMEASIKADMLGGDPIAAKIDSLAPASGSEFAILPPQNATGNFTKIVQRVPVKLVFSGQDNRVQRLKPGTSLIVKVDTKANAQ